ncbi:MAG: TlpA disulfide reductase family protein [Bacteroidota bacterium]
MKRNFLLLFALIVISAPAAFSQAEASEKHREFPAADVKALDGSVVSSADFENDGKPMVVSFWATWCKPCILELQTILDEYDDWQDETGVKLIAVSIDDARNSAKVQPFVSGKEWPYEVYIDNNQDLKRALQVNNVPATFLLNGKREIVYQHNSYSPGDEEELYDHILETVKADADASAE